MLFDLDNITIDPRIEDCLNGRDIKEQPFLWGLEEAPDNLETI